MDIKIILAISIIAFLSVVGVFFLYQKGSGNNDASSILKNTIIQNPIGTGIERIIQLGGDSFSPSTNHTYQGSTLEDDNAFTVDLTKNISFEIVGNDTINYITNATLSIDNNIYSETSQSNLTAWLTFNENGENAQDRKRTTVINTFGSPRYNSSCVFGPCMQFDDTNDLVVLNNTYHNYTSAFSLWLSIDPGVDNQDRIMDSSGPGPSDSIQISYTSGSQIQMVVRNGGSSTGTLNSGVLNNQTWYNIIGSVDNTTGSCVLYVNGVWTASDTSCFMNQSLKNITIGNRWTGASNFFNGTIDDFRLYQRNITDVEALQIYQAAMGGGTANLVYQIPDGNSSSKFFANTSALSQGTHILNWTVFASNNSVNNTGNISLTISAAPSSAPVILISNGTTSINSSGLIACYTFDNVTYGCAGNTSRIDLFDGARINVTGFQGSGLRLAPDGTVVGKGAYAHAPNPVVTNMSATTVFMRVYMYGWGTMGTSSSGALPRFFNIGKCITFSNGTYDSCTEYGNPRKSNNSIDIFAQESDGSIKVSVGIANGTYSNDFDLPSSDNTIKHLGNNTIRPGEWFSVAMTMDNTTQDICVYVNGEKTGCGNYVTNSDHFDSDSGGQAPECSTGCWILRPFDRINFGKIHWNEGQWQNRWHPNATIDDFLWFNRSLTNDEIRLLHSSTVQHPLSINMSASISNGSVPWMYKNLTNKTTNYDAISNIGGYTTFMTNESNVNRTLFSALYVRKTLSNLTISNGTYTFIRNMSAYYSGDNVQLPRGIPFNDSTTLVYDGSGNNYDGFSTRGPKLVTGKYGNAMSFQSSSSDYLDIGRQFRLPITRSSNASINGSFSVAMWVNVSSANPSGARIISYENATQVSGFEIDVTTSGQINSLIRSGPTTTSSLTGGILNNTWTFVVLTFNSSSTTSSLYINGTRVGQDTTTFMTTPNNSIRIAGRSSGETNRNFDGGIDEFMLFEGVELTANDVSILYNNTITAGASNFVCGESNSNDADITYNCYRNATSITHGVADGTSLTAGFYVYTNNQTEGQNVSSSQIFLPLMVNAAGGGSTNPNFTDNRTYSNLVLVQNTKTFDLANISFDVKYQDSDNDFQNCLFEFGGVNYTTSSIVSNVTVRNTTTRCYANLTDQSAGSYVYKWHFNDSANLQNSTGGITFVISRAIPNVTIGNSTFAITTQNLTGYWRFEGEANDYSGNGYNGTITEATSVTDGFGKAYSFDGSNDNIATTLNLQNKFSISFWYKATSFTSGDTILSDTDTGAGQPANGFTINQGVSNGIYFTVYNGISGTGGSNFGSLNNGEWHHLVAVFDGSTTYAYTDGVLKDSDSGAIMTAPSQGFTMGGDTLNGNFFNGVLDEVMVFNKTLNSSEISILYGNQVGPPTGFPYLFSISVTGSDSNVNDADATYTLYRNGSSQSNPDTSSLSAGEYFHVFNVSQTQNYTRTSLMIPTNITKKYIQNTFKFINGTGKNLTINEGEYVSVTGNTTTVFNPVSDVGLTMKLYDNDVEIDSCEDFLCINGLSLTYTPSVGTHRISTNSSGNTLYYPFNNNSIYIIVLGANLNIQNSLYSPVYETNWTTFNFSVNTSSVSNVTAYFMWNNTNRSFDYASRSGDTLSFMKNLTIPLLVGSNRTNITTLWSYNVVFSNGTVNTTQNTTQSTQEIQYAYNFSSLVGDRTTYLQTDVLNATGKSINKFYNPAVAESMSIKFNGTTYGNNSWVLNETWTGPSFLNAFRFGPVPMPTVMTVNGTTIAYNATYSVSYGGNTRTSSELGTITILVYKVAITTCTGGSGELPTIGLFTYNETSRTNVSQAIANNTIDAVFTIYNPLNKSLSFSNSFALRNNTNYYICLQPNNNTLVVDGDIRYQATSDRTPRSYFLRNASLTNITQEIKLFVLEGDPDLLTGKARRVKVVVKDSADNPLAEYIAKGMKYYQDQNNFETVEMTKSDYVGEDITYLQTNDIFYKFIVEKDNVVKGTFSPFTIKCSDTSTQSDCIVNLVIDIGNPIEFFNYDGKIAHDCSYINSTLTLTCTFTDTSGWATQMCLEIDEVGLIRPIRTSSQCVSSTAATIGYTFSSFNSTKKFQYKLYSLLDSDLNTNKTTLESGGINWDGAPVAGTTGLVLAFIVIGVVALLGLFSPLVGIMMMVAAMVSMEIMGILDLGVGGTGAFAILGLFIWYWMSRGRGSD